MKIILFFYLLQTLIKTVWLKCRMQQKCDITDPNCIPGPAEFTEPEILEGSNIICEEFRGKKACCNDSQNILMTNNFKSLDQVFGSSYGGCDICAINLKRLYCHFTCSDLQDTFCKYFLKF